MSSVICLIVGVSKYFLKGAIDLPFCINDLELMEQSLITGLQVNHNNIFICGSHEIVTRENFDESLNKLKSHIKSDDTVIFYFSGHGCSDDDKHYLCLSNDYYSTSDLIENIDSFKAKNKIIFIDSCNSGNFSIDGAATFNMQDTVNDFFGRGYAVLTSSNNVQYSYKHPNENVSLFTYFLCNALVDKYIIRNGKKSLHDINRLTSLLMDIWYKKNKGNIQTPIYRANIGGTVFFDVADYKPYIIKEIIYETERYIIHHVEPSHHALAKRYGVFIILKEPFSFEEIAGISKEIIVKSKDFEVFQNQKTEDTLKYEIPNIVWCYYCRDEQDIADGNYICHTTWVDENQDKNWWYKLYKDCFIIDDIHFKVHDYYDFLKKYIEDKTGNKNNLLKETKSIMTEMISLAQNVIYNYNEFQNKTIEENELIEKLAPLLKQISIYFFKQSELDIAPIEIKDLSFAYELIAGTIHDFTICYGKKYIKERTQENRIACMDMKIKRYYSNLEKIKEEEKKYFEF